MLAVFSPETTVTVSPLSSLCFALFSRRLANFCAS